MMLSVIIPFYNAQDFIRKSYNSISAQDILDIELLYINNNSIDNSEKEVLALARTDDRVKLLQQPKQGASSARNLGIKNAKGKYVYVFDVDDEIFPNALKKMISVLEQYTNQDAVFGRMIKSSKSIARTIKPLDETLEVHLNEKPYWGLLWFSDLNTVVGPPGFLYRSSVFEKIGYYNESIKNNEDTAFDIKLGMSCNVAFLDMYVYLYYKYPDSTIQRAKKKMPRAFMIWPRLIKEHVPYYLENQVPLKFKRILFSKIFKAAGRQIVYTSGFLNRLELYKSLKFEMQLIHIPLIVRIFLKCFVVLPFIWLRKFYEYYIVPHILNNMVIDSK